MAALCLLTVGVLLRASQGVLIRNSNDPDNVGAVENPIAASRLPAGSTALPNVPWASAGVSGGIPTRTTACDTIAAYTGTAATINTAIAGCASGQVVELGAGTFTLSTGITFGASNVTLRGAGADSTKLIINGVASGCGLGFIDEAVRFCTNTTNIGCTASCGGSGPTNSTTWGAGYTQGTTVITIASKTNLAVGSTIFLDQLDDASDGYPATGDWFQCAFATTCAGEGGNSWGRTDRVNIELHDVTAIEGGACAPNCDITIDPPILSNNYRSGQTPGAWWGSSGDVVHDSGIEDLTIDFTGGGAAGVFIVNATDVWIQGVRLLNNAGSAGSFVNHITAVNVFRGTFENNYIYGPPVQGNTQYSYTPQVAGSLLFQNNILHHNVCATCSNDPESGSVYAYNYVDDSFYATPGFQQHNSGDFFNLIEGNDMGNFFVDSIHGTHHFLTLHRNYLNGTTHNQGGSTANSAFSLNGHSRFFNLLGNVIGGSPFTTYETESVDSAVSVFNLGYKGNCSQCGDMVNDTDVKRTMLRWGNWNTVTSSDDNGTNDQTGTRWNSGEVPSGIATYSNPLPGAQTIPTSYYLAAKPAWFGSLAWPPIGPDVSNSVIATATGGHANKIPARVCFEAGTNDAAYGSSSPRIKAGVASACATP
jgi:hypothetical protein